MKVFRVLLTFAALLVWAVCTDHKLYQFTNYEFGALLLVVCFDYYLTALWCSIEKGVKFSCDRAEAEVVINHGEVHHYYYKN